MKAYYFLTTIAALALVSCGTTYQAGQTPDAVYYSPEPAQKQAQPVNNQPNQYAVAPDSEEGSYVVYQDGDEYNSDYDDGYNNGYSDGYYSRRINMFDRPGGLFSYNYNMMSPMYGGSYLWNRFSYNGFGRYYNPYRWSPGLSFGMSWGNPYAFGGWNSHLYNPFYSYGGYYNPYYHSGYYSSGLGWGGKYSTYEPRPAVSYQPRRAAGSRASHTSGTSSRTQESSTAPRRVFTRSSSENVQTNDNNRTRRSFKPRADEKPTRRVRQNDNTSTRTNTNTRTRTNTRTSTQKPTRRVTRRPQPRVQQRSNTRTVQPSRSVSRPSTSTRSTSTRTSSPRRR